MILSNYMGLNSENLARLALTLCYAKVIKGQDTKKEYPFVIRFHLIYKTCLYSLSFWEKMS